MKCNLASLVLFTTVAIVGGNVLFQEEAKAWADVCNRGSTRISRLAIGYLEGGDWKSEGWWNMNPGECKRVYQADLKNSGKMFYIYVEGERWALGSKGALCVATNRNFTFFKGQIESMCGQVLSTTECKWGTNGAGCTNVTTTYYTKFVNFDTFNTRGRNFTLNLSN